MTSVYVIGMEELEQEFSPGKVFNSFDTLLAFFLFELGMVTEEIEESEYVECTQVETVNSPFAYLLANMLQGGGRNRRDMVSSTKEDLESREVWKWQFNFSLV